MTWGDWVPVLVTTLSLAGAAGTYSYQRYVDRGASLTSKRREVYAGYVLALQRNLIGKVDVEEYQSALASIFIYGADEVVIAVAAFHNEVADKRGTINSERATKLYAAMVSAMRADSFESSKLTVDQLQQLVPFK